MYLPTPTSLLGLSLPGATHPRAMPVLPASSDRGTSWAWIDGTGTGPGPGPGPGTGDDDDGINIGNWSSLIGIVTAIVGNILIALALNVQRYSHIQIHRRRIEARERAKEALKSVQNGHRNGYGTADNLSVDAHENGDEEIDDPLETHPLAQSYQSGDSDWSGRSGDEPQAGSSYLKSPSWWTGQVLMTIGEMGNFLAYGFAPASIVSPLGVVALISNCVIAPIFFGEVFRKRDFWGVVIAVAGAVTVVLSANQEETKLDPHGVWDAITTLEFEVYMGVTIFLIIVLMWASPRYGHRTILIDLGLVGLFGGYTALTTKGVSSMLSSTLFGAFATPVTYGLIVVLLLTAVMQVRYVNKALQRFDSTQVIPIQFVLFTLSVIIGSAILYRDFERTTAEQAAKFVGGCLLTFFGVFLITSGRPRQDDEEDQLSDDENVETIGLRYQEASGPQNTNTEQPRQAQLQTSSATSSRRSSHASRTSFPHASVKSLVARNGDNGPPSSRRPDASASRTSLSTPVESSPLLANPWRNSVEDHYPHPGLPPTFSADSVATIHSITSTAVSEPTQSSMSVPPPGVPPPSPDRPTTPRASVSFPRPLGHHYSNAFISPSPLSSTVSAVVADAFLKGEGSPVGRRRSIKRMRTTLRSSLFVPQDEDIVSPSVEPLLRPGGDEEQALDQDGEQAGEQKTFRGRARSLSNTLGEFFGRKKRRRGLSDPDPETGQDLGGYASDPSILERPDNSS
ncbi:magnesium transporter NIPA-domain-containing protein [Biscogniauxia marginata]|nr:magnesium transporter NIPA-domain-containing protein [Biscogniauxia marginata]